jgi:hypothetical protein
MKKQVSRMNRTGSRWHHGILSSQNEKTEENQEGAWKGI